MVLEFPSYVAALACYRSSDYQAAAALRKGKAEFDLFVIEGYDGPQTYRRSAGLGFQSAPTAPPPPNLEQSVDYFSAARQSR